MNKKVFWLGLLMTCLSYIPPSQASDSALEKAKAIFKATFTNLKFISFKESPIPGLFEASTGDKIIYFHPESEVLIFGELFSKAGESLTAKSFLTAQEEQVQFLPLEKALVIGPEGGVPLIEFTDPNCPYCRTFHEFTSKINKPVKRVVFFATRNNPDSFKKAIHILCAKDPTKRFSEMMTGIEPNSFDTCEQGRALAKAHAEIENKLGISATPTFFIDGARVIGFQKEIIEDFLASNKN